MSNFVDVAHVDTFSHNIGLLLQQRGSKFAPHVTPGSYKGKQAEVINQVGEFAAVEIQTRHEDTAIQDVAHARRWVFPRDYGAAAMVDRQDLERMLVNPTSTYAVGMSHALGRQWDDIIIDGILGNNRTGQAGGTTVTLAADGGGSVAAGGNGMTLAKLREAKRILMANEVDLDHEEIWCGISAEQHEDLLSQTQVISSDYNPTPVLVEGRVTQFLGVNFLHSERLPVTGTVRSCPLYVKSMVHSAIWGGVMTSVDRLPTKWNNLQVMATAIYGATRQEGEAVVEILCDEA